MADGAATTKLAEIILNRIRASWDITFASSRLRVARGLKKI